MMIKKKNPTKQPKEKKPKQTHNNNNKPPKLESVSCIDEEIYYWLNP